MRGPEHGSYGRGLIDLTGRDFGALTVLHRGTNRPSGGRSKPCWVCRCTCGVEKEIDGRSLRTGATRSCGCRSNIRPDGWRPHNYVGVSRWLDTNTGYVTVAIDGKRMKEHRYMMEVVLGRPLLPHEHVHHKNGDKTDNNFDNLELWSTRHPKGQRVEDLVSWAREILARYGGQ